MKPGLLLLPIALAGCLLSGAADARGGKPAKVVIGRVTTSYNYYNRPGADLASHDAAVKACLAIAEQLVYSNEQIMDQPVSTPPQYQGTLAGPMGSAIVSGMNGTVAMNGHIGVVASGVENCMLVLGWRVVSIPEEEGDKLVTLSRDALVAKIAPWIGAEAPHGKIVRVFANEAAFGTNQRLNNWVQNLETAQLSVVAATGRTYKSYWSGHSSRGVNLYAGWAHYIKPGDIASVSPDSTVIVIGLRGFNPKTAPNLVLELIGPDSNPSGVQRITLNLSPSRKSRDTDPFGKVAGPYAAFVAPAGRWRIGAIGGLTFCLGAPAFEAKAGEVVFAGDFDFSAPEFGPILAPDGARAWLGAAPAAASLRVADYVNGTQGLCGGNAIYALEIPGAPFEPSYSWGSRVSAP